MKRSPAPRRAQPTDAAAGDEVRTELAQGLPSGMDSLRFPTFRKYQVMSRVVENLNVRHKRNIFQYMRDLELAGMQGDNHTFIPVYGITLGEFSMFQLMN
jgi:hypothetical protein